MNTAEVALLHKISEELDILYNHFCANEMVLEESETTASQMISAAMASIDTILNEY